MCPRPRRLGGAELPHRRARESTAHPRTPPARGRPTGRRAWASRRPVAIAPAAPTMPPSANERSLAGADHRRPCDDLTVRLTTLGDLLLDVVVQLDGSARARATTALPSPTPARAARPRTSPPGRRASAPTPASCASAARTRRASSPPASSRATAPESSGPSTAAGGVVVSFAAAGDRTMASDRGVGARSFGRTSSTIPGSIATCCTSPATHCCASRSPPPRLARRDRPPATARASRSTSRPGRWSTTRSGTRCSTHRARHRVRQRTGERRDRRARRDVGREARRARHRRRRRVLSAVPVDGGRRDRRRRRARGRLPGRRARARPRPRQPCCAKLGSMP